VELRKMYGQCEYRRSKNREKVEIEKIVSKCQHDRRHNQKSIRLVRHTRDVKSIVTENGTRKCPARGKTPMGRLGKGRRGNNKVKFELEGNIIKKRRLETNMLDGIIWYGIKDENRKDILVT